jgi:hypothetical protein
MEVVCHKLELSTTALPKMLTRRCYIIVKLKMSVTATLGVEFPFSGARIENLKIRDSPCFTA